MPGVLRRPQQRRELLRGGAGASAALLVAPLAGCDESPAAASVAWRGPAANVVDPRLVALSWAILAPSPHNSQPWLANLHDENGIGVRLDARRLLPIVDPQTRQALISLGAFLELLTLAAAAQGLRATISRGPDGDAEVQLSPGAALDQLLAALPRRRSTKLAYDLEKPVTREDREALSQAAGTAVAMGFAGEPAQVAALREIVLAAFLLEYGMPVALEETVRWIRLGATEVEARPDGLALTGTAVWWLTRLRVLSRESLGHPGSPAWHLGRLQWENLIAGTASFGWLVTADDSVASRVAAGRAYQRVDLAAAAAGVAIHPVSQALGDYAQMFPSRLQLDTLLGIRPPARVQMLFRVGYAGPQTPSPRRSLMDVLVS